MPEATQDGDRTERSVVPRGTGIGRYLVLSEVGRGGMGVIYAAFDPDLDRRVALKLLPVQGAGTIRDLGREARVLAKLAHPNVASIFDVGTTDAWMYIAMELVEGGDLATWLKAAPREPAEIVSIFAAAGRGLSAAHDKGVVHRDFKPANILVGEDGRPRVADFGLARLERTAQRARPPGDAMRGLETADSTRGGGTPGFIAPEVLAGAPADQRSDQYSFCVALVSSLTGSMPDALTDVDAELGSRSVPRRVRRAVERGLAVRPEDRFASMEPLLAKLTAPRGPRRRIVGAVTLGLLAGAAISGSVAAWPEAPALRRCERGQASLRAVWNEDRAGVVREGLVGGGQPHAAATADRVHAALEDYAGAWSDAHASLCGPEIIGAESEGRLRCLDDRLIEIDATLSALGQPDGAALDHASTAVAKLRAPAWCTEPDWRPPPPALEPPPSVAVSVAKLRPELEQGAALERTGQFDDALALLHQVAAAADAIGFAPLCAEARYAIGMTMMEQGRYEDAELSLREAFARALAGGHDEILVAASALLLYSTGGVREKEGDADLWHRLGVATIERGDATRESEAVFWQAAGAVAQRQGRFDDARAAMERGLALSRAGTSPTKFDSLAALSLLAGLEIDERRYAEAERRAREVLELRTRLLGAEHPDLIVDHITLASALTPQGRPDEAIEHLERALQLGAQRLPPEHPRRMIVLNNLAAAMNATGDHERAAEYYAQTVRVRERDLGPGSRVTAFAHSNLAYSLYALGDLEGAIEHNEQAVTGMEASVGPRHVNTAQALNGLATSLETVGRCDDAAAAIDRAWAIVVEDGAQHNPLAAAVASNRAVVMLCQGEVAEALAASERAIALAEANPTQHNAALPKFRVVRARAELAAGRLDASKASAHQALRTLADGPSTARARAGLVLAHVAEREESAPDRQRWAEYVRAQLPNKSPRNAEILRQLAHLDGS